MDPKVKVDLVGLNRFGGTNVVVQLRYTNGGSEDFTAGRAVQDIAVPQDSGSGNDQASGIGIIDAAARRVLLPYRGGGTCLCSSDNWKTDRSVLSPGESATFFGVVPAPSGGAKTTTVITPDSAPLPNVPISDQAPTAPPGQPIPALTPGLQPVSHVITSSTEAVDDSDEIQDDGKNLRVNLRADVLFALNKADLSGKAQAVLKETAKRIDESPAAKVQVEGHTDNSGNDAINEPLSQHRADNVAKALQGLVTRSGVGFEAKGYGSTKPQYKNDSEEGRRRNRRVTVIFARPKPPAQTPAPGTGAKAAAPVSLTVDGQPFAAQVTGVKPIGNGLGVLGYRLTNNGTTEASVSDLQYGDGWMNIVQFFANNVGVIDTSGKRRYQAATYPTDVPGNNEVACLCSPVAGTWAGEDRVPPQGGLDFWAVVQLPVNLSSFGVQLGKFPRIEGVSAG
ncbi:OmpA family protein [Actinomadura darangshiensis]|uniref:OmpA family protein n=2 Tax=Actinomadura darangshiensis TaxID=705336 RepID=A0A4R5B3S9_9ACTN|nr:OmpA family protein [Actinomadura darangshiensis]